MGIFLWISPVVSLGIAREYKTFSEPLHISRIRCCWSYAHQWNTMTMCNNLFLYAKYCFMLFQWKHLFYQELLFKFKHLAILNTLIHSLHAYTTIETQGANVSEISTCKSTAATIHNSFFTWAFAYPIMFLYVIFFTWHVSIEMALSVDSWPMVLKIL